MKKIMTILILSLSMLCACGKKDAEEDYSSQIKDVTGSKETSATDIKKEGVKQAVTSLHAETEDEIVNEENQADQSSEDESSTKEESSTIQDNRSKASNSSETVSQSKKSDDIPSDACEYLDTTLTFDHAAIEKSEFDGEDMLFVYYIFTNNSDKNKSFSYTYTAHAYQNGVEIEDNYFYDSETEKNGGKEIMPGFSITVCDTYEITDFSSPIIIQVEPWVNFGDKILLQKEIKFN